MAETLLLTCGEETPSPLLTCPATASRVDGIDIYALAQADIGAYRGLLVSAHADQRFLVTMQERLERFLRGGGILVICGHLAYPFLPELSPFVPLALRSFEDYRVWRVSEHPVFAGVDTDDLSFRKGVAGFYGRGHNPPPAGARVLQRLSSPDGPPLDYVYRRPGGGRVLVHSGNDLWMYANDETSARRIAPQLLDWIESPAPPDRNREGT